MRLTLSHVNRPGPTVRGDGAAGEPRGSDPDRRNRTLTTEGLLMRKLATFTAVAALAAFGFAGAATADPYADAVASFVLPAFGAAGDD